MKPAAPISIDGPAGRLEIAINDPGPPYRGVAVIAHPHPLHGGTLDNKVVVTLAKAFFRQNFYCLRPNYRGVGGSEGSYDEGRGEVEDALAATHYARRDKHELPLVLAGFSFGACVQAKAAHRLRAEGLAARLVLVAPVVSHSDFPELPQDTLLIHGEHDEVQPFSQVLEWAKPRHLPVVVVAGSSHFFHGCLNVLASIIDNYFRA
ncbi:MAG: alpha/beta hydrolase [Burkholderiales bacterium]